MLSFSSFLDILTAGCRRNILFLFSVQTAQFAINPVHYSTAWGLDTHFHCKKPVGFGFFSVGAVLFLVYSLSVVV